MKTNYDKKNLVFTVVAGLLFALILSGCSDDQKPQKTEAAASAKKEHNPFDHSHDVPVTDVQKHKFEHDFAQQCIQRELEKSNNKADDEARWQKPCMCIAQYLMKGLTADEAEKFLTEHKNTQSLVIKYESAAYHCLQAKSEPKSPNLFGRPESAKN